MGADGVPSKNGLVVCTSSLACDAGASVMTKGGNAVDAAVATAFALAVTHPSAGNIGGGGFMVIRTPSGETSAIDYRERAPQKSTRTMYLKPDGTIDISLTSAGYLAPGVPGTVRGLGRLLEAKQRRPVEPAIAGARCPVSANFARDLNGRPPAFGKARTVRPW